MSDCREIIHEDIVIRRYDDGLKSTSFYRHGERVAIVRNLQTDEAALEVAMGISLGVQHGKGIGHKEAVETIARKFTNWIQFG